MINTLVRANDELQYSRWYEETNKKLKIGKADFDAIRQNFLEEGIVTRRTEIYGKKQERQYYKLLDFPHFHLIENYPKPLPRYLQDGFMQMTKSEKKYFMKDLASRALFAVDSALLTTLILTKETGHEFHDGFIAGWVKNAQNLFELFRTIDNEVAWEIFEEWERKETLRDTDGKKSDRLRRWLQQRNQTKDEK